MTLLSAFAVGLAVVLFGPVLFLAAGYVLAFLILAVLRVVIGDAPSRYP